MYLEYDSPISAEKDDDMREPVEPLVQKRRGINKLSIAFILLSILFVAVAAPVAYYRTKADHDKIITIERELQASARIKNLDVRGINVYRSADGKLVASWDDGTQHCSDVPIIEPSNNSQLYGTAAVADDSGKCQTSSSSKGINPGGN